MLRVFQENLHKDVVRITDRCTSESGQKLLGNDMQHLVIRPKRLKRHVCALASLRTDRGIGLTGIDIPARDDSMLRSPAGLRTKLLTLTLSRRAGKCTKPAWMR
jgi:hypothetical protein